jgi:hypothetical protein
VGRDVASATSNGVELRAKADDWQGDRGVLEYVTPVYVTLINNGSRDVQVRYATMSLLGREGQGYAALPPFEVTGSIDKLVLAREYHVVPRITYNRFQVAPFYGSVYSAPRAESSHWGGVNYYDAHYPRWTVEVELPTQEMLEWALPEGVLASGGTVSGYVYFQKVPTAVTRVTLDWELVDASSSQRFGIVRIPFTAR